MRHHFPTASNPRFLALVAALVVAVLVLGGPRPLEADEMWIGEDGGAPYEQPDRDGSGRERPRTTEARAFRLPPGGLAVGDSVMLGARAHLEAHGFRVDAAVSRSWYAGLAVLAAYRQAGEIPHRVVVGLGNNGPIEDADFDALMELLRGRRQVCVVTVNTRDEWDAAINAVLRSGVRRWGAAIVDWYRYSERRPDVFWTDNIHLQDPGEYADLIRRTCP